MSNCKICNEWFSREELKDGKCGFCDECEFICICCGQKKSANEFSKNQVRKTKKRIKKNGKPTLHCRDCISEGKRKQKKQENKLKNQNNWWENQLARINAKKERQEAEKERKEAEKKKREAEKKKREAEKKKREAEMRMEFLTHRKEGLNYLKHTDFCFFENAIDLINRFFPRDSQYVNPDLTKVVAQLYSNMEVYSNTEEDTHWKRLFDGIKFPTYIY